MSKVHSKKSNRKRGENKSNNADIKPPSFPSPLTMNDLIKPDSKTSTSDNNNNKPKKLPNAFIAYRMALIKENRSKNRKLPPMGEVSKIARNFWKVEHKHVKSFYESLVKDAKSIYKQCHVQIVLDKHMNDNTNDVESEQTLLQERDAVDSCAEGDHARVLPNEDAICTENLINSPIQESVVSSSHNGNISSTDIFETPSELNSTLNNQEEYIGMLEQQIRVYQQVIDCLLRN